MNWEPEYCEGVKLKPVKNGEFCFDFPKDGHVNLIGQPRSEIPVRSVLSITYRIRGNGKFKSLDQSPAPPGLKPNFRPMIFNGDWYDNNGRWWATGLNCAWLINEDQVRTYEIKLIPKLWSNVVGKQGASSFKTCLKTMKRLYLAFGGGNSFSHGVSGVGSRFELISVKVKIP